MKDINKIKNQLKIRRIKRVRAKVFGTAAKPRLAVFRSLKHISIQAINDKEGVTIASSADKEVTAKTNQEKAMAAGKLIAKKLMEKGIESAVFDKRHYKYHGLVKSVADGAREQGLKF